MIVKDNMPLKTVEKKGFQNFIKKTFANKLILDRKQREKEEKNGGGFSKKIIRRIKGKFENNRK